MDSSQQKKFITGIWYEQESRYAYYTDGSKPYELPSIESAPVAERLEKLVARVEAALPNVLSLTNQLSRVLSNSVELTSNLNAAAVGARPAVSNLATIIAHLDRPGALGEWLLPTNIHRQVETALGSANTTLGTANATLDTANTNLALLAADLDRSLENLANLTSNLNAQVQVNTNILSQISRTVMDADDFIQGLKHHWLLRSAFKTKPTNAPPPAAPRQRRSPKD
jgi:ABC-type transporter Mla subunit MlaD